MTTIAWQTTDGRRAEVEVALETSREVDADGYKATVDCCDLVIEATVEGRLVGFGRPVGVKGHPLAAAKIGKLGIPAAQLTLIEAAIGEIEASPIWRAKLAAERVADFEADEYERNYKKIMNALKE